MKHLLAATILVLTLPALALAQKTSFDYAKTADFSKFKTYTLKDGTKAGDPLIDNRIVAAIETELKGKGLTRNDASPDIAVVYHIAFEKSQDVTAYNSGYGGYGGYGYHWGGGFSTTDVRVTQILTGTLIIDVADAVKKEIAWRGTGVKEVDVQAKAEKLDKNVAGAVAKILKNFPPPVKK